MNTTKNPDALQLADIVEQSEGWTAYKAAAELRRQHARIVELEAQLSAIGAGGVEPLRKRAAAPQAVLEAAVPVAGQSRFKGEKDWHWCSLEHVAMAAATPSELQVYEARYLYAHAAPAHPAEGVPAQTETLLAELAEETEAAENWRRLALQFDHHRLQALGHLKAILHPDSSVDEYKTAELFLKAPPLDGESVLAQRIAKLSAAATQAQEDAPVGFAWSGWACMYPGKLPRLYGALEIASVNLDAANGDQLIHLSTSPDPKAQADARDVERWMGIGKAIERACADLPEETEIIVSLEKDAGTVTLIDQDGNEHENFSCDYGFAGVLNEAIDAAIAAQTKN